MAHGRRRGLVAALAGLLLAGCGAPSETPLNANVRIMTGRADGASDGLSISTADWTYGGGFGFAWTDSEGSWHQDGRPDCLPQGASRQVTFAATEVTVNGASWRPIVWLDCR